MTLTQREKTFKELVDKQPFPPDLLEEFYFYWTEPNKSGTKMRFELEKTWDLSRRLRRWEKIRDSRPDWTKKEVAKASKPLIKAPENDLERLEVFYTVYGLKPTSVSFDLFGQWFEFMKDEGMLIELKQEDKEMLKNVYGNNGGKLKCAWVQMTLDYFMKTNYQFRKKNLLKAV